MPETNQNKINPPAKPAKPKASFMQTWWRQYYKLATGGISLVILGLGYILLLAPKITAVQNIANTVLQAEQTKEAALKTRVEYLVNLEAARAQISDEDINRIKDMLPAEPGVPELFASLESIAIASSVKLESIQFSKLETNTPAGKAAPGKSSTLPGGAQGLEIQLTVANTPYSNVKTLVSNIEKSLRIMDVTALIFSPAAKSYSLTVRSYYLP